MRGGAGRHRRITHEPGESRPLVQKIAPLYHVAMAVGLTRLSRHPTSFIPRDRPHRHVVPTHTANHDLIAHRRMTRGRHQGALQIDAPEGILTLGGTQRDEVRRTFRRLMSIRCPAVLDEKSTPFTRARCGRVQWP